MIIWIDGTYGVGKTKIASILYKKLNKAFKLINSDKEYLKMIKKDENLLFGGTLPQNNENFIINFRKQILCYIEKKNRIIIDMALTDKKCKEELFDYFINSEIVIIHFICNADNSVIKNRIVDDKYRDKENSIFYIEINKDFLKDNFKDAIWINTNSKTPEEIADEMFKILKRNYKKYL